MKSAKYNLWYLKIIAKIILSRLPINYKTWSKIGLFRHGAMDDYTYAWKVLSLHASFLKGANNWNGLELGPGDGILSALLAPAIKSSGLVLIDSGNFAHNDINKYHTQIMQFKNDFPDLPLPNYSSTNDIEELLDMAGGSYHTDGLKSLNKLESDGFDLIFSQAVLEHVRLKDFEETMLECKRLLKPNGIISHVVDYKDHLGGSLNNMRFPSSLWEKNWFASKSGFYTNRLRISEMIKICKDVGLNVEIKNIKKWDTLPINRGSMANEFESLSDDDLLISGAHLIMYNEQ